MPLSVVNHASTAPSVPVTGKRSAPTPDVIPAINPGSKTGTKWDYWPNGNFDKDFTHIEAAEVANLQIHWAYSVGGGDWKGMGRRTWPHHRALISLPEYTFKIHPYSTQWAQQHNSMCHGLVTQLHGSVLICTVQHGVLVVDTATCTVAHGTTALCTFQHGSSRCCHGEKLVPVNHMPTIHQNIICVSCNENPMFVLKKKVKKVNPSSGYLQQTIA